MDKPKNCLYIGIESCFWTTWPNT
uniref:Uncharacterized protein n=1 Tax=Rhizophora mucronata TaxID=61149 RepID=A0A2P2NLX6_RHIMU